MISLTVKLEGKTAALGQNRRVFHQHEHGIRLSLFTVFEREDGSWATFDQILADINLKVKWYDCYICGKYRETPCGCHRLDFDALASPKDYNRILRHNQRQVIFPPKSSMTHSRECVDHCLLMYASGRIRAMHYATKFVTSCFEVIVGQGVINYSKENGKDEVAIYQTNEAIEGHLLAHPPSVKKVDTRYVLHPQALEAAKNLLGPVLPHDIIAMIEPFCISIPPPDEFIYYLDGLRLPGGIELLRRGSSRFPCRGTWEGMPLFEMDPETDMLLADDHTLFIYERMRLGRKQMVLHIDSWVLECEKVYVSLSCYLRKPTINEVEWKIQGTPQLLYRFTEYSKRRHDCAAEPPSV
jgi:hypothetical protein